ncbi:sulfite exporter TauE/SafE family protein [Candidatus Roizmanbacteria bacterium]|nr:sulfite exporter TauE/SafE family protein [Candidatus Roizmanbacteria bacterium]
MELGLIIPAFVAGVLTILAPCTLPLVPAYIGFISGSSLDDLKDPQRARGIRRKILLNGVLFVLGFTVIFVSFGILIGFVGSALVPYRIWLTRIGGALVVAFGLYMLGILKLPFLNAIQKLPIPQTLQRGKPLSSLILGASFATGWTPCVGPILGSVLLLATTTATALKGGLLLLVFSSGLALPFLLIAAGIGSATAKLGRISKYLYIVEIIAGIFLVFLGVLLFTNNLGLMIIWGYSLLQFIGYDRLLNYL